MWGDNNRDQKIVCFYCVFLLLFEKLMVVIGFFLKEIGMKVFTMRALLRLGSICAIGLGLSCAANSLDERVSSWCDKRFDARKDEFKKVIELKTFDIAKAGLGGLVFNDKNLSVSSTSVVKDEVLDYFESSAIAGAGSFVSFCLKKTKPANRYLLPTIVDPLNFFIFTELNKNGSFDPNAVIRLSISGEKSFLFDFYLLVLGSYIRSGSGYDALYSEKGNELLVKFREENTSKKERFRLFGLAKATGVYFYFNSENDSLYLTLTDMYKIRAQVSILKPEYYYIYPDMLTSLATEEINSADLLEAAALLLKDKTEGPWILDSINLCELVNKLAFITAEYVSDEELKPSLTLVKNVIKKLQAHKNKNLYELFGKFFEARIKEIKKNH